jgi:hypothetical protein
MIEALQICSKPQNVKCSRSIGFKSHCGLCETNSFKLLLTYAVECGLKVLLMNHYRVTEYAQLPEDAQIGHDLREGLKQLRCPEAIRAVRTTHGQGQQEDVHPVRLHEAFRYGIPLHLTNEVTDDLKKALNWIDSELS